MSSKSIFLFLFVLFTSIIAYAEENNENKDYYVYSVEGSVKQKINKTTSVLNVQQTLSKSTVVTIGKGARLVVIDSVNSKQHTITTPGTATITNFVNRKGNTTKNLSKTYLAYLLKQIHENRTRKPRSTTVDTKDSADRGIKDAPLINFATPDSLRKIR